MGKLKHSRALRLQFEIHQHYVRVMGITAFQRTLISAVGASMRPGGSGDRRGSVGAALCYTPAYLPPKPESLGLQRLYPTDKPRFV